MSVNKVTLIGNLGQDPEIRHTQSGDPIANLSIATSEKWKDETKTEWHRVVAFKKLAEIIERYLKKGSQVYIEGKLQTRKWQDKDGNDRYTTEIVAREMKMLGGRDSATDSAGASSGRQGADGGQPSEPATTDFQDDDLPF